MGTIDLDAIMHEVDQSGNGIWANQEEWSIIRAFAKKVIQKAIVLASESAKLEIEYYKIVIMHNRTGIDIKYDDSKHFAEKIFVDKQSILDVYKLIV